MLKTFGFVKDDRPPEPHWLRIYYQDGAYKDSQDMTREAALALRDRIENHPKIARIDILSGEHYTPSITRVVATWPDGHTAISLPLPSPDAQDVCETLNSAFGNAINLEIKNV